MSDSAGPGPQLPTGLPERSGPHHRSPDTGLPRLLLIGATVVLLILVAGGTTWWMYTRAPVDSATPLAGATTPVCPSPSLRVVAAPEIAPVVEAAAQAIGPPLDGCPTIEVTPEEPFFTSTGNARPDVWIPSSSAWLRAGAAGKAYEIMGGPLATSPIVLAAPSVVRDQFASGDRSSWAALMDGVTGQRVAAVSMPDPRRSTVGMLSVYAVNQAMARTTDDPGIAQLRALALRSRLRSADADSAGLLGKVADQWSTTEVINGVGVFPVTEQQLTTYQKQQHTVRLERVFTTDAQAEADYPFAVARQTERRELAGRLRAAIAPGALTAAGFRTEPVAGRLKLPARMEELFGPARSWADYRTYASQVLVLIDASGSMNDKIKDRSGKSTTRAALLRESGRAAAELFDNETSIGMWYFGAATPDSPAHTEAVPFGPILGDVGGKLRRDVLAGALSGYRADDRAGTPLFQSVLDATAEMRGRARDDVVSLIVVLTDGEDGETRFAMPSSVFLSRLKAAGPVPVIAVGYGPGADMSTEVISVAQKGLLV